MIVGNLIDIYTILLHSFERHSEEKRSSRLSTFSFLHVCVCAWVCISMLLFTLYCIFLLVILYLEMKTKRVFHHIHLILISFSAISWTCFYRYGIMISFGNRCNQEVVTSPYWVYFSRLKRTLVLSPISGRSL